MFDPEPLRRMLPQTLKAQQDAHEVLRVSARFYRALAEKDPGAVRLYSRQLTELLKDKGITDQPTQNLIAAMGQLFAVLATQASAQSHMTFDEVLERVSGGGSGS